MRFLLLSSLLNYRGVSADPANGTISCGTKDAKAGHAFVSEGSCDDAGKEGKDCAHIWWDEEGKVTTNETTASCAYDKDPWKYADTLKDGLWDPSSAKNYEVKVNYVAIAAADAKATKSMTAELNEGFAALAQGEKFDAALFTGIKAGVLGINATAGTPTVFCSHATRKGFRTLTAADNKVIQPVANTKVGRCAGGALDETLIDANMLDHNAAGDGTKKCFHLPWKAAYKAADACTKTTHVCDRFVEAADLCVEATKQMKSYAQATDKASHCTIQPGAKKDDKYRHMDENYSSQACTKDYYCNPYGTKANEDPICIQHSLGTSAKAAARVAGAAEGGGSTTLKWCIGVTLGAKQCTAKQVCNPHAATRAELCINNDSAATTAADYPKSMAFGAVGAVAPTPTDTRAYCIGDNAAGKVCPEKTVCNYAGGDQAGVAGGDVCLPHAKLLGTIADTAPWTAAAQRKLDGVATKFCLATNGTTFSSKECATTEKCNPHASSTADVCKKGSTVLNHGDIAPAAAEPTADSIVVCIGKSVWKNCKSADGDIKEVCNEGAVVDTDVCILTTDCANPEEPLKAFRDAGVEAPEDQKWCFATDGAAKCGLDTLCNPSGVDGGTGSAAICADATKRVPHGEAATEELIHCYGDSGNAALATDESEDGWLCDEGKGKFHDPKTKMEPRSKNETPDELPDGEKAVDVCFGKDKVETCDVGEYCNSMGTDTGCSLAACTSKNICITEESMIAEGEQWVDEGKSVCLNADATAGEDCTTDKMYCDQTEGVCSAEEIASTEEPSSSGDADTANGCATQSLAAAAVVAILTA